MQQYFSKFTLKQYINTLLCFAVGVVFIFSAISKLPTLEQFGWIIVEGSFLNWTVAEWLARFLVGIELFVGILFIAQLYLKKMAVPSAFILLAFFTLYLFYTIHLYGNTGNCGCFGEVVPMSPLHSIYKNLALIILVFIIAKINLQIDFKWKKWIVAGILIICLIIPIAVSPPESIYLEEKPQDQHIQVPLSLLYSSSKNMPPKVELRKGKHILAFMSLTCHFCRKAGRRMSIMKKKYPEIPFFMVLNGDSSNLKPFFEDTKTQHIDYILFNGADEFARMNGGFSFPSIKWMIDTTQVRTSNYINLNDQDILAWLKK